MIKQIFLKSEKINFYNIIFYTILLTTMLTVTFKATSSEHTLVGLLLFPVIFITICFLSLIFFIDREKFVAYYIICIPIIPLYQDFLPSKRWSDISIEILFLEMLFLSALIVLYLTKKNINIETDYKNDFKIFNYLIFTWIVLNLASLLFSIDIYRSIKMFLIGILSPAFVFYLIANKTKVNYKTFYFLIFSLFASGIVFMLIASYIGFKQSREIGEFIRLTGKNIYGSNSLIGTISFILPLMFLSNNYYLNFSQSNISKIFGFVLFAFRVFSIIWILFAVSRWGYATFFVTVLLVILFDRNNLKYYWIIFLAIITFCAFFFFQETTKMIINRFTNTNYFTLEAVYKITLTNQRWDIWRNAWEYFKGHIVFGIGLGNHYIISQFGYTTAHNMFLNVLVERGILVFIILLGIVIYFYKTVFNFRKKAKNYKLRRFSLFLAFSITTFLFWSLTGTDLIQSTGYISAIKAYYFSFILALQFYIMKLDSLNPENTI